MPSLNARESDSGYLAKSNLVRNPREPREKARTGGTTRWKSHDAYSTVPSPPSYTSQTSLYSGKYIHTARTMSKVCGCS